MSIGRNLEASFSVGGGWFVHEAGWHRLYDGSRPGNGIVWHERMWDLHLWIDPDGVSILNLFEPFGTLPGGTLDLPEGTFFSPTYLP